MSDIQSWLAELGLEKYAEAFAEAEIEIGDLHRLSEDDLKELGLPLGPRRRLNDAVKLLSGNAASAASSATPVAAVASEMPALMDLC